MCQYSAVDGFANDWHLVHFSRAAGGAGLIIQKLLVFPEGRISRRSRPLKEEHIEKLAQINQFIVSQNSWNSLAHAGRKASAASPWNGGRKVAAIKEVGIQ
jgi:2,4-dienoyl-CoA reductase-like NADH-dependent reductase (Old Yellow Enzyme family)